MSGITVYEFDALVPEEPGCTTVDGLHGIPVRVFAWLEKQALRSAEAGVAPWLRLTQKRGCRAVQVMSYVGVIQAPDGYQIEVLPKIGKVTATGVGDHTAGTRSLLIEMLRCLGRFRHIQTDSAKLAATRMPLLEVFIGEFLMAVEHVVKRGLRSDYLAKQDNLFALRGKLQLAQHLRHNLCRRDRFFAQYDEFSQNRAENRLLHAALRWALSATASQANQQLARELCFVFADIPPSRDIATDFQQIRLDRGMVYYSESLAWARLILEDTSPLTGPGGYRALSLLFPMEAVFEAFVAKHLARQLCPTFTLKTQMRSCSLVKHQDKDWFRLKPDLLVKVASKNKLVLDTKWKLLDTAKENGTEKYGLMEGDFYQLHAYGHNYLDGEGDVVMIYPETGSFANPLSVFEFPKSKGLRLWVLPFSLKERVLRLPDDAELTKFFLSGAKKVQV